MRANDWLVIQEARARREGVKRGALLATPLGIALGVAIMLAVHIGLTTYAGRVHDEAMATINADLRTCRADVARYKEVADLEKAYAERTPGP